MRADIGLCEYGAAERGAWFASEAAQRHRQDGVAIPAVGPDEGEVPPAAVIRSAAA
ncbi:hypothetical protein [Glycomyces algeriensis]|uniref:Uncharacterized protein n=1 Tax=Glycomyces algeriensis TaxID=256037 RepID=A0A9W6GA64_9ACTN|nr:hypothetical protein [Glycomyces algeriensis]MDA1364321.1 hypothetical protein [Glycomyces algeriensis]MDR7350354.1 hypothetical protein [Glycomyces algeriensis]GLI43059.1 hypothetical protein GALLR39Z86_29090 [Glycomyces algeriensis]